VAFLLFFHIGKKVVVINKKKGYNDEKVFYKREKSMSAFVRFGKLLFVFSAFLLCRGAVAQEFTERCRCDGAFCACPGTSGDFAVWSSADSVCQAYGMRLAKLEDTGCSLLEWDCPYARAWGWLLGEYQYKTTVYGLYAGMSLSGLGVNKKDEPNWALCVRSECDECLWGGTCENICNPTMCGASTCTGNDICCNGECKNFCDCFPEDVSCNKCVNHQCRTALCQVCDSVDGSCVSKCAEGTECCNGQCYDKRHPPTLCHQWSDSVCGYVEIPCQDGKECCRGLCYDKNSCGECQYFDEETCRCANKSNGFSCGNERCYTCQNGTCVPMCSETRCETCGTNGRCESTCTDRQTCNAGTCECKTADELCGVGKGYEVGQNCECVCPTGREECNGTMICIIGVLICRNFIAFVVKF